MTIEEQEKIAKSTVNERFCCNGKYKCSDYNNCIFGNGKNNSYDCNECCADDFYEGFLEGLKMSLNVLENGKVTR